MGQASRLPLSDRLPGRPDACPTERERNARSLATLPNRASPSSPRRRLRRRQVQKALRPRARPPALRHVHRRQLRAGAAPPGLRAGQQLDRRGDGRLRQEHLGHDQQRRLVHGRGRRPRHPRRAARADLRRKGPRRADARSRHDQPQHGGQVRQAQLQDLRRPARHRPQGGQFPLQLVRGPGLPRRRHVPAGIRGRHAAGRR